jgi:hypothetical protein
MEEVILKLEQENDESEMYSMILAVVKGLIKNTHFVPITHGIDSAYSNFDGKGDERPIILSETGGSGPVRAPGAR